MGLKILGLTLLAMGLGAACFRTQYSGFTRAGIDYLRYASFHETRNLVFCLRYWFEFVGKLSPDREGFYDFANGAQAASDFEGALLAYHQGDFGEAAGWLERDIDRRGESEERLFWLAMCHMRSAEAQNCLALHPSAGFCALPLKQHHGRIRHAKIAASILQKLLDRYDRDNRLYQWLLNFNYMAMGGFPQDVPGPYLIRSRFVDAFYGGLGKRTEEQLGHLSFADLAAEMGVATYDTGRGVAVEDFDNDGYLDIVTGGSFDVLKYYKNDRGRRFLDRTERLGPEVKQPFFISAVDYDNDGWVDVFVTRMLGRSYALLRNNRDGTFSDVTDASGLLEAKREDQAVSTWTPAWADVDNDGRLDLFLAQLALKVPLSTGILAEPRMESRLFLNRDGRFLDATSEFGLAGFVKDQYFVGAAFGDYDSDGYPDLFLSTPIINGSLLLRNIEGKRLERTAALARKEGGFAAAFVDVDHDGRLDIFQAGFADARTSVEASVFGQGAGRYRSGHSTILMQAADGRFEPRDEFFDMPMGTMGSSFGDLDNDGCYDFYLGTGTPEGWFVLPNLMYLGERQNRNCTGRLINISMLHGVGSIQKGHGIVFADFDDDGKQDVYSSLGGMWPADRWPNQLFMNRSTVDHSWVKLRLRGRKTNYFGVGARIRVFAETLSGDPIVRYYRMDAKTGFGSAPFLAHIGLLDAVRIREVEVVWPASGCRWLYPAGIRQLNTLDEKDCAAG